MSTPLDHFRYDSGELRSDSVSLARIAQEQGTPVYVYSAQALLEPFRALQKGLKDIDHLICFAMKANSNLSVIKLLANAGAGLDLVSGGELYRAGLAGVAGEKVVFSGVGKTREEMTAALEYRGSGIFSFHVESIPELVLLNEVATARGKKAPVSLRFNPDVDAKTHPYISTGLKKNKFGLRKDEILAVARRISEYPAIDLKGISIHIGSQLLSLSPLNDAFTKVRALLDQLAKILPVPIRVLDLGGGVGITYKNEKPPSLEKYCALILKHFGPRSKLAQPVKILIEPGRTISGNSGVLLSRVLYRKVRGGKDFLVVDAAMNDLVRPALYGSYHEVVTVSQARAKGKKRKTDIVGPVCESSDCFGSDRMLPAGLDSGDLIAILSAGAYGFSMSSSYNSRPRPAEVLIENGQYRVIRERERLQDLVRGEKI